jgi:L-threonylcarbamoyladenylate synthase
MILMPTNSRKCMVQDYPLHDASAMLRNSGLVLFPTDTLWCIGGEATDPVAVLRLIRLYQDVSSPQPLEILVDSLDMLKRFVPNLHPKLETLLLYHVQPLSIQVEQVDQLPVQLVEANSPIAFRIVQATYCRQLIQSIGKPIASMFATFDGNILPAHFGAINSDVVTAVDLVAGLEVPAQQSSQAAVMVRLTEKDELEFLRE